MLEPVEARIMMVAAALLLAVGVVVALSSRVLAYPFAIALWLSAALSYRGFSLWRRRTDDAAPPEPETGGD